MSSITKEIENKIVYAAKLAEPVFQQNKWSYVNGGVRCVPDLARLCSTIRELVERVLSGAALTASNGRFRVQRVGEEVCIAVELAEFYTPEPPVE